jgi:BNR repeat-containing family member/PKD domain/Concanavalin A-like lectin/glucanases superfamily
MVRAVCYSVSLALALWVGLPAGAMAVPPQRSLGEGAWCWFADPRGVHYEGAHRQTFIGWVAGDGDIKVAAFDHDSGIPTTAVLHSKLQVDDHSNPALLVWPDGRVEVFYAGHNGNRMYYRVTRNPEDITSWEPEATMPTNTSGPYGFTYPNPIRLGAESKTYLFWRGGNYNPTFSTRQDGQSAWSPAQNLLLVSGQRPYVKYDAKGGDTIGFAFTNAHPAEASDVNVYFAYYKNGGIYKANGSRIASLGTAIAPSQADKVFDTPDKVWVHDMVFDSQGKSVIVFADFVSATDHRYRYARWTGDGWVSYEITPAGGSISLDGKQPYYSGGITLDHENPNTVYLSRAVGGIFEVETWTTPDGGKSWSRTAVTASSSANNYRPISPRGLIPFSGDMSVVWMRGIYQSYIAYQTSITATSANGGTKPPIADAEWSPHQGRAPQRVSFDGTGSSDPDGTVTDWSWDFDDGTRGSGSTALHTYTQAGRYFPKLTVTDNSGARGVFVGEVAVDPGAPPTVASGGATAITSTSATLNGSLNPQNQATSYHFEYGTTSGYGSATPNQALSASDSTSHAVSADVTGLIPGASYHYRLVATNPAGTTAGDDRTFTATPAPTSRYRDAVVATSGLAGYWRLGEQSGTTAADETNAAPGSYLGGYTLGQPGALAADANTSVTFDGIGGEMSAPGPALAATAGSLEGWFNWQGGVALMRDGTTAGGWILAYDSGGSLYYRLGGTSFNTGLTTASVRTGWHHFAATTDGTNVAFYLDGQLKHTATGAGTAAPTMPWHIMRNGGYAQYTQGQADEVAIYNVALPATTVQQHYNAGKNP